MALPPYVRRFAFGGVSDQKTPEEAGFYDESTNLPGLNEGRRCVLTFDRTMANAIAEDAAQISFEFVNTTGGVIDNTWTAGDFTTLETALATWWTSVRLQVSSTHTLATYKWYAFGPSLPLSDKGYELAGPPRRVTVVGNAAGGAGALLPLQVAISCTFKTALRRRWGRYYLPGATVSQLDASGRVAAATRTNIASNTDVLFDTASAADFLPVVYSSKKRKAYSIEAVQVDDVPDVIRRRRAKRTGARTVYNS